MTQPLRRCWIKEGTKQAGSIPSNNFGQSLSLGFPHRQARLFTARTIAIHPLLLAVSTQPVGSNNGQTVKRSAHRFPDTEQSIEGADLGEHVGGIGALSSAS